jgi:hypothetical protein
MRSTAQLPTFACNCHPHGCSGEIALGWTSMLHLPPIAGWGHVGAGSTWCRVLAQSIYLLAWTRLPKNTTSSSCVSSAGPTPRATGTGSKSFWHRLQVEDAHRPTSAVGGAGARATVERGTGVDARGALAIYRETQRRCIDDRFDLIPVALTAERDRVALEATSSAVNAANGRVYENRYHHVFTLSGRRDRRDARVPGHAAPLRRLDGRVVTIA